MRTKRLLKTIAPFVGAVFYLSTIGSGCRSAESASAKRVENVAKRLREETAARLGEFVVQSPSGEYVFRYPELNFRDNFEQVVAESETPKIAYYLCGFDEIVSRICADNSAPALSAQVTFGVDGFSYEPHRDGYACLEEPLREAMLSALATPQEKEGKTVFPTVQATVEKLPVEETIEKVKGRTKLLANFTTYFQTSDEGRTQNIVLACRKIDGKTIRPSEEFSFNAEVGARTAENGFSSAKVIQNGEFVKGLGGGVCQVSTTLYNAVLLSGLSVTEFCAHSLAVGYVPYSRDAMVSEYSDFRFLNAGNTPVYLSAKVKGGAITVKIYGKPSGKTYKITSVQTGEIEPPAPIERVGLADETVREGRCGVKSESYLETYQNGALVSRVRLRKDEYAPVRGIIVKKMSDPTKKIS